jgi:CheY-like chemotaxis protein
MNLEPKTILIIDDDARNIFALTAVLKAKGFSCTAATNVNDALQILLNNKAIAVVLLDIMMPDIDGYEAVHLVKHNEATAHIPVIAVTAQAMPGDKEKALNAGADNYISKPVDVDELLKLLREYI